MDSDHASEDVFISYSHADHAFVARIIADLQAAGINPWIDQSGLVPGTPNWDQAIRNAISTSAALILVASPSAYASPYVHGELSVARDRNCPIIPVWASGDRWTDCIPLELVKTQAIDCRGAQYDTGSGRLIAVLHNILAHRSDGVGEGGERGEVSRPVSRAQQALLNSFLAEAGHESIGKRFLLVGDEHSRELVCNQIRLRVTISDEDLLSLARLGLLVVYADPPGVAFTTGVQLWVGG